METKKEVTASSISPIAFCFPKFMLLLIAGLNFNQKKNNANVGFQGL